jgi:hypothetical protein
LLNELPSGKKSDVGKDKIHYSKDMRFMYQGTLS